MKFMSLNGLHEDNRDAPEQGGYIPVYEEGSETPACGGVSFHIERLLFIKMR